MQNNPGQQITFFYTVRTESDALFWEELQAAASQYPHFQAILNISSRDGSLTTGKIAKQVGGNLATKHVYLCEPASMTHGLSTQLRAQGVPKQHIHYEEFNFC
jgi:predicted ferric reductase